MGALRRFWGAGRRNALRTADPPILAAGEAWVGTEQGRREAAPASGRSPVQGGVGRVRALGAADGQGAIRDSGAVLLPLGGHVAFPAKRLGALRLGPAFL